MKRESKKDDPVFVAVTGKKGCLEQIKKIVSLYTQSMNASDGRPCQKTLFRKSDGSGPFYYLEKKKPQKKVPSYSLEKKGNLLKISNDKLDLDSVYASQKEAKQQLKGKAAQQKSDDNGKRIVTLSNDVNSIEIGRTHLASDWQRHELAITPGLKEGVSYSAVIICYLTDDRSTFEFLGKIVNAVRQASENVPILLAGIQREGSYRLVVKDVELYSFCVEKSITFACQFSMEENKACMIVVDKKNDGAQKKGVPSLYNQVKPEKSLAYIFEQALIRGNDVAPAVLRKPALTEMTEMLYSTTSTVSGTFSRWSGVLQRLLEGDEQTNTTAPSQ